MVSYSRSDFYDRPLARADQPLVSVITPVYNGEEFLAECIESVLAQTYENWDYTIVNNCSTDRTLAVARTYAAKDSRIRVLDCHEFLPIIQNHNRAIEQISPQSGYCKVVLADDWLFPDCIMKMVTLAEAHPNVGLVGAYGLHGDGMHVIWRGLPFPHSVVGGREVCRLRLLSGRYVFGAPTATLVRSDFIRKSSPFYDEANLHADTTVCFKILQQSDFGFIHQLLTFTRTQGSSTTTFSERMNTIQLCFLTELIQFGPAFLDKRELEDRLEVRLTEYYRVLAEGLLQMRGTQYLEFHKKWLRTLGIPLKWNRLLGGFCMAGWNAISHPGAALKSVTRRWSKAAALKSASSGASS